MPVGCSVSICKLSTDELRELDYRVMRHAFDSQNELGRLADERIYQADLAARLRSVGMKVTREVEIQLMHRGYCKSLLPRSDCCRASGLRTQSRQSDHRCTHWTTAHLLAPARFIPRES